MWTCPMQLKLYIPFQPQSQIASTVAEKTNQSPKDAPIIAAAVSRPSRKTIKPQVVLAPLYTNKKKEPAPAKLTETPAKTKAGGNK